MTTQRQEEDKITTKTAREQKSSSSTSTTSTTTSNYTEPGVSVHDLEVIRQYYNRLLGPLNCYKAADIERAFEAGLDTSAILDALDQTAMAPRPSHPYLAAILGRYMREGITTAEKAEAQRFQRRHGREMAKMEREHAWYSSPDEELDWYSGR